MHILLPAAPAATIGCGRLLRSSAADVATPIRDLCPFPKGLQRPGCLPESPLRTERIDTKGLQRLLQQVSCSRLLLANMLVLNRGNLNWACIYSGRDHHSKRAISTVCRGGMASLLLCCTDHGGNQRSMGQSMVSHNQMPYSRASFSGCFLRCIPALLSSYFIIPVRSGTLSLSL